MPAQLLNRPERPASAPAPRLWVPKHVVVTRSAADLPHTAEILRRVEAAGVTEVDFLRADRLTSPKGETEREAYARAEATLAVVVAPPSQLKPQPIPPSADWRLDLARGCPAHCQYCYLAGSLSDAPITRVYANLDDILAPISTLTGHGTVTTGDAARGIEGTTFELSATPTRWESSTSPARSPRRSAGSAAVSTATAPPCASPPSSTRSSPCSSCRTAAARASASP